MSADSIRWSRRRSPSTRGCDGQCDAVPARGLFEPEANSTARANVEPGGRSSDLGRWQWQRIAATRVSVPSSSAMTRGAGASAPPPLSHDGFEEDVHVPEGDYMFMIDGVAHALTTGQRGSSGGARSAASTTREPPTECSGRWLHREFWPSLHSEDCRGLGDFARPLPWTLASV